MFCICVLHYELFSVILCLSQSRSKIWLLIAFGICVLYWFALLCISLFGSVLHVSCLCFMFKWFDCFKGHCKKMYFWNELYNYFYEKREFLLSNVLIRTKKRFSALIHSYSILGCGSHMAWNWKTCEFVHVWWFPVDILPISYPTIKLTAENILVPLLNEGTFFSCKLRDAHSGTNALLWSVMGLIQADMKYLKLAT